MHIIEDTHTQTKSADKIDVYKLLSMKLDIEDIKFRLAICEKAIRQLHEHAYTEKEATGRTDK